MLGNIIYEQKGRYLVIGL